MTVHVESKHEKGVHVRSQRHSQCYILDLVGPTVTPPAQPSVLGFSTSAKQHSCWYSRFSTWMLLMMRTLLRTKRCLLQPLLPGRRERAVAPGEYGTDRARTQCRRSLQHLVRPTQSSELTQALLPPQARCDFTNKGLRSSGVQPNLLTMRRTTSRTLMRRDGSTPSGSSFILMHTCFKIGA